MQPVTVQWQPNSPHPSSAGAPFAPTVGTDGDGVGAGAARGSTGRRVSDETQRAAESAALAVGQSLGKYEIRRKLGHGGQAQTFLAYDPDLRRLVVIKYYHSVHSESEQEQVLREGRALARVRSPYVAQCFGAERHEGVVYLVLEYIPGQSLAERVLVRPFDVPTALRLTRQVAAGLAAIHACGLLHLDLKPANVLLGEDDRPRIVDFGLAATVGSDRLRQISGTPAYMAPEQARGEVERIDPRTDLFGLGAVLYELLTGQPPYRGESQHSIWSQARRGDIVPPVERRADLSSAVNELCLRCLAKEVGERWNSATELAAKLDELTAPRRKGLEFVLRLGCFKLHLSIGISLAVLMCILFGLPQGMVERGSSPEGEMVASNHPSSAETLADSNAAAGTFSAKSLNAPDQLHEPRDGGAAGATLWHSYDLPQPDLPQTDEPQQDVDPTGPRLMMARGAASDSLAAAKSFWGRPAYRDLQAQIEPVAPARATGEGWELAANQSLRLTLRASQACYAEVWAEDETGAITQLFPNGIETDARLAADVTRPLPGLNEQGVVRYAFPQDAALPWRRLIVRLSDERPAPVETQGEFPRWTTPEERDVWFTRFAPPSDAELADRPLDRKQRRGDYVIPVKRGANFEEAQSPRP